METTSKAGLPEQPLVTLLTPTFNDAEHLPILIQSVFEQTYTNWEWIIIDDCSTDDTQHVLGHLSDPRVRVLSKENGDQLLALAFALPYVFGDFVTLIHSDDTFVSKESIAQSIHCLISSKADGLYANYCTMDGEGRSTGELVTPSVLDETLALKTVIQMGTNFAGDHFFVRRAAFESHVVPNYICQNTIYYFDYEKGHSLRLIKGTPWYRYRVFAENYIHSDIGKFVALSGQFRTTSRLINGGVVPGLNLLGGYTFFRLARRLNLHTDLFRGAAERGGAKLFGFWVKDLLRHGYPQLLVKIAAAISHSYSVCKVQGKARLWQAEQALPSFAPPESRRFYRTYERGNIPSICLSLLDQDFDHIVVTDEFAEEQVRNWLNFFSLQYPVVIQAA